MITILVGKSGSGKDTVQSEMCKENWERIVPVTTRPIREGETEGVDYHFASKQEFMNDIRSGSFAEYRSYNTLVGGISDTWYYGTPKQKLDKSKDYVVVLDVQGAKSMIEAYGRDNCFVVSLEVDDKERERRAMKRSSFDKTEWDRRCADDEIKFSDEALSEIANYRFDTLYYQDDVEGILYCIEEAMIAYEQYHKKPEHQYIVEGEWLYSADNLDPPEDICRVYDKKEIANMIAYEDKLVTEAEYATEIAAETSGSSFSTSSIPSEKEIDDAVELMKQVLVKEYNFTKPNARFFLNDYDNIPKVMKTLGNYTSSNGKGMILMKRAIDNNFSKSDIEKYQSIKKGMDRE